MPLLTADDLKTCGTCLDEGRGVKHAQVIPDPKHGAGWIARCCECGIGSCLYPTIHDAVKTWNECYGPDADEINGASELEKLVREELALPKRTQMVCIGCFHVLRRVKWDLDAELECLKCGCYDWHWTKKEAMPQHEAYYNKTK